MGFEYVVVVSFSNRNALWSNFICVLNIAESCHFFNRENDLNLKPILASNLHQPRVVFVFSPLSFRNNHFYSFSAQNKQNLSSLHVSRWWIKRNKFQVILWIEGIQKVGKQFSSLINLFPFTLMKRLVFSDFCHTQQAVSKCPGPSEMVLCGQQGKEPIQIAQARWGGKEGWIASKPNRMVN